MSMSLFPKVNGSMGTSFRGIHRRLSSLASNIFSGTPPIKILRNALELGDEEKALEVYTTVNLDQKTGQFGSSLMDDINPSNPFPSKKTNGSFNFQTPLHLAARVALYRITTLFLEHLGNPNVPNGHSETCLHTLCQGSDKALVRREIMELFLNWKGENSEVISVNHVDGDGNIALHYAAANGLVECVERLVELNSILSLVNKSHLTCCEMADERGHKDMASMLELAILFQPNELIVESDVVGNMESRKGMLILDSISMKLSDLQYYMENVIDQVLKKASSIIESSSNPQYIGVLTRERMEVILNAYSWDSRRLLADLNANPSNVFTAAKLQPHPSFLPGNSDTTVVQYCGICSDVMGAELSPSDAPMAPDHIESILSASRSLSCPSGHRYCVDCWRSHLSVQVKDNGGYCLSCPGFKCQEIVNGGTVWAECLFYDQTMKRPLIAMTDRVSTDSMNGKSSSNPLFERFFEQRSRHLVDCCSSSMKWCPNPDCGTVVQLYDSSTTDARVLFSTDEDLDSFDSSHPARHTNASNGKASVADSLPCSAMCQNCHTFCLSCSSESHTPCSCDDWTKWQSKVQQEIQVVKDSKLNTGNSSDDMANALWLAANTKRCPRCTSPIEKDEGCNHMNCRKCRHEFCWICMQDWTLHSNTTGGFFQCNRYVSELVDKNGEDRSGVVVAAAEELGNAHLETMRMRERGNKMARFIPLYTRLKAQSDSVQLEKRMYPETMARIINSLESTWQWSQSNSMKGDSKSIDFSGTKWLWLQNSKVPHPYDDDSFQSPSSTVGSSNPPCLQYLQAGFEELIKCRHFLIGCVAYSFNTFAASEEEGFESLIRALSRRHQRPYASHQLSDHKQAFERLQGDLEMYTEMLSDVVARRRLRASNSQIKDIVTLARSKRLELEEIIFMFNLSEKMSKQSHSSKHNSNGKNRGNRSNASHTNPNSHSASRHTTDANRNNSELSQMNDLISRFGIGSEGLVLISDGLGRDNDELDPNTIAALFQELERYQSQAIAVSAQETTNQSNNQNPSHAISDQAEEDMMTFLQSGGIYPSEGGQVFEQENEYSNRIAHSPREVTSTVNSQTSNGPETSVSPPPAPSRTMNWLRTSMRSNSLSARNRGNSGSGGGEIQPNNNSLNQEIPMAPSQRSRLLMAHETQATPTPSEEPSRSVSPRDRRGTGVGTLSRAAEEEAALNRAILMSLSDFTTTTLSAGNASSTASPSDPYFPSVATRVEDRRIPPSSTADVEALIGMGFSRDIVITALSQHNLNFDMALNSLSEG